MAVNGIEVTDVVIFPLRKTIGGSETVAFARVIINDQFLINGVRILEGTNGPFIRFPQEITKDGKSQDLCFPITAELRSYINDQVLSQYSITKTQEDGA